MVHHIYGKKDVITTTNRPHMFIKELSMYVDYYYSEKVNEIKDTVSVKQEKYITNFKNNLNDGIDYYQKLFSNTKKHFELNKEHLLEELDKLKADLFAVKVKL